MSPPDGNGSCRFGAQIIANGGTVTAYQSATSSDCTSISEVRRCTSGVLSGSFTKLTCSTGQPVNAGSIDLNKPFNCSKRKDVNGTESILDYTFTNYKEMYSFCSPYANTGICGYKIYVNGILIPDSRPTANQSVSYTCTQSNSSPAGPRGCTDDNSVPIIDEINFATTQGYPNTIYPFSSLGEGITKLDSPVPTFPYYGRAVCPVPDANGDLIAPKVAAIRLRVVAGSGWRIGVLQIASGQGYSEGEAVISRCRGQFGSGGREKVMHLDDYNGPENNNSGTWFARGLGI